MLPTNCINVSTGTASLQQHNQSQKDDFNNPLDYQQPNYGNRNYVSPWNLSPVSQLWLITKQKNQGTLHNLA